MRSFGIGWMWQDAKKRGINPLPWALGVLGTGSLALLVYSIRRNFAAETTPEERLVTA